MNTALVFLKPHAARDAVDKFAREHLSNAKVKVVSNGVLSAEEIKAKSTIDKHYAALAASAVSILPAHLAVPASKKDEFKEKYGVGWDEAAAQETLLNLAQFQNRYPDMSVADIEAKWRAGPTMKLAPGNYVSMLTEEKVMVINGFYGSMREKFIAPGVEVWWYVVEFDDKEVKWKDFRGSIIGATDPHAAADGSLRSKILKSWQELGLGFEPSTADNGVHASAGPIEGLKERITWLGVQAEDDVFGKMLVAKGVKGSLLERMLDNEATSEDTQFDVHGDAHAQALPIESDVRMICTTISADLRDLAQVFEIGGKQGPCYDLTEDMDSAEALEIFASMAK